MSAESGHGTEDRIKNDEVYLSIVNDAKSVAVLEDIDVFLLSHFSPVDRGTVLQLGCATPTLTEGLLDRMTGTTRLVVVDSRLPMIDAVRFRTGRKTQGKIFFKSNLEWKRLPFDEEVFVSVASSLFWDDSPNRLKMLAEMKRVLVPGGKMLVSLYTEGCFREIYDLLSETVTKFDLLHLMPQIQAARLQYPSLDVMLELVNDCGFDLCRIDTTEQVVSFPSAKELFDSPVARALWLPRWVAAIGEETDHVLWHTKQAMERYFAGRSLELTLKLGVVSGMK